MEPIIPFVGAGGVGNDGISATEHLANPACTELGTSAFFLMGVPRDRS